MTYDETNQFIKNYIENDKTGRAIMLTGDWGTGKSHYIRNVLIPFLSENGNHQSIVISLYGITDLNEISKIIYIESRIKLQVKKDEKLLAGKVLTKTVLKGVTSFFNIDISQNNDDLNELYTSIDLSNKLIIFEDVERSKVDLITFLGYVNNLCEQDGVKVLLIANESELIQYEKIQDSQDKDKEKKATQKYTETKKYTETTLQYLKVKEKTVGDTIHFVCDYEKALAKIIGDFGNALSEYSDNENIKKIYAILFILNSFNLRAFIYSCQKTSEIFEYLEKQGIDVNKEAKRIVFHGTIAFTQRQSRGEKLVYNRNQYLSANLGLNSPCPLFRFCYDYIIFHTISKDNVEKEISYFENYCLYGKWNTGRDSDLNILKYFYKHTEKEVSDAIKKIHQKLNKNEIPFYDYGTLANYLIAVKYEADIDFNLFQIESAIINNLRNMGESLSFGELFSSTFQLYDESALNEFNRLKQEMKSAMDINEDLSFNYDPDSIINFCKENKEKLQKIVSTQGFAHTLEIPILIEMLKKCSSSQLGEIRSLFLDLYSDRHISQVLPEDIEALKLIFDSISTLKEYSDFDKIQRLQIKWFIINLQEILQCFSR